MITGPTGSGKTALAHRLYRDGDIIINADSRQIYRFMDIGTAKPSREEITKYNYNLIDFLDPRESWSAWDYLEACMEILHSGTEGRIYIVGGSSFYINVLSEGLAPHIPVSPELRQKYLDIFEQQGIESLLAELEEKDPLYYEEVDRHNPRRILRALEVIAADGRTFTEIRAERRPSGVRLLKLIVTAERNVLYERINHRVEEMCEAGLVEEVSSLLDRGYPADCQAMTGIGYREIVDHLQGHCSLAEAADHVRRNTRRFAKQQISWLRSETDCLLLHRSEVPERMDETDAWIYDKISLDDDILQSLRRRSFCDFGSYRIMLDDGLSQLNSTIRHFYED